MHVLGVPSDGRPVMQMVEVRDTASGMGRARVRNDRRMYTVSARKTNRTTTNGHGRDRIPPKIREAPGPAPGAAPNVAAMDEPHERRRRRNNHPPHIRRILADPPAGTNVVRADRAADRPPPVSHAQSAAASSPVAPEDAADWFAEVLLPRMPRSERAGLTALRKQTEASVRVQLGRDVDAVAVVDAVYRRCFHELYRRVPAFAAAAVASAADWELTGRHVAGLRQELGAATTTSEAWAARARAAEADRDATETRLREVKAEADRLRVMLAEGRGGGGGGGGRGDRGEEGPRPVGSGGGFGSFPGFGIPPVDGSDAMSETEGSIGDGAGMGLDGMDPFDDGPGGETISAAEALGDLLGDYGEIDRMKAENEAAEAMKEEITEQPLTPEDIIGVLEARGWEANIVASDDISGLVEVESSGILKCVDGRGSDNTRMKGPKMLGGIYGIAQNRGVTSLDQLKGICQEVRKAGHVPSVHGDAGGMLGCGFCKLWLQGEFEDLDSKPPSFTAEQGAEATKSVDGVVEMHYGSHAEKIVYINLVPDTTLEPNHDDQRFVVDAWAAGKFNLDVPKYLVTAAATVERLGGPKKAVLIVNSPTNDGSLEEGETLAEEGGPEKGDGGGMDANTEDELGQEPDLAAPGARVSTVVNVDLTVDGDVVAVSVTPKK